MNARETAAYREHLKMIALAIDTAPHGQASLVAVRYAETLGCAVTTLHRWLKTEGIRFTDRKPRSDKGATAMSRESMEMVAALQKVSRRRNNKLVTFVPAAVAMAAQAGFAVPVSPSRVRQVLRDRGMDAAMQNVGSAPTQITYDRINEVHQFDWSVCLLYLSPDGKIREIREDVTYKNKPDALTKHKLKVLRGIVRDMASGWMYVHYVEAAGENQLDSARVLLKAWSKEEGCIFHGLPEILHVDKGIDRALGLQNMMASLEIKMIGHAAGNARATGGVEGGHNIWETHFEGMLKHDPVDGFADPIAELNIRAFEFCNRWNANLIPYMDSRLTRHGLGCKVSRTDLFLRGLNNIEVRLCPADEIVWPLMQGATVTRKVPTNRVITYRHPKAPKVREYDLREFRELRATEEVTVRPLLFAKPEEILVSVVRFDGEVKEFRVQPVFEYNQFGFRQDGPRMGQSFNAAPETDVEKIGKRLDQLAYGITGDGVIRDHEEIKRARLDAKVKPFAHLNDGEGLKPFDAIRAVPLPTYLDRPGKVFEPKVIAPTPATSSVAEDAGFSLAVPDIKDVAPLRLDHVAMAMQLKRRIGDAWTPDKYPLIQEWYPDGCLEEELAEVEDRVKRHARIRLVQ